MIIYVLLFVALSLIQESLQTERNPTLSMVSKDSLEVGQSVTMNCTRDYQLDLGPFTGIKWLKSDILVALQICNPDCTTTVMTKPVSRFGFTADWISHGSMTINQLILGDSGNYHCELITQSAILSSNILVISVRKAVALGRPVLEFRTAADNHTDENRTTISILSEGMAASFTCTSRGSRPPATIAWFLGEQHVMENVTSKDEPSIAEDGTTYETESSVVIVPRRSHHWKVLRCQANFTLNSKPISDSKEVRLVVKGPPDAPHIVDIKYAIEGQPTTVTCTTGNAYPAPTIHWYLGASEVTMNASIHTTFNENHRLNAVSSLTFIPTGRRGDEFKLTCSVIQHGGRSLWPEQNATTRVVIVTSGPSMLTVDQEQTTSSSLFVAWQLDLEAWQPGNISLSYCLNRTKSLSYVADTTHCERVTNFSETNMTLKGLMPYSWYSLILEVEGAMQMTWSTEASTAPPAPDFYGITISLDRVNRNLVISQPNATLPRGICLTTRNTEYGMNCSNESECHEPGSTVRVSEEDIPGLVVIALGRGLCSIPSYPTISNPDPSEPINYLLVSGGVLAIIFLIFLMTTTGVYIHDHLTSTKKSQVESRSTRIELENGQMVDDDGLVYIALSHDQARSTDPPPIHLIEEPIVYASVDLTARVSAEGEVERVPEKTNRASKGRFSTARRKSGKT